jgi:HEAT repeat protein
MISKPAFPFVIRGLRVPHTFLLLTLALLASGAWAADSVNRTARLIAVLQSNASFFEKARACQQLSEVGNRDAVPALAALLSDAHLSAYARSGLEGIPDPSAVAALREAAAKLKPPLLTGVVNSLGVLRDQQSVELLGKLAADADSGVAGEALLALGNILVVRVHSHPAADSGERARPHSR